MFDEVDDTIKRTRKELVELLVQIGLLSYVKHFATQTIIAFRKTTNTNQIKKQVPPIFEHCSIFLAPVERGV